MLLRLLHQILLTINFIQYVHIAAGFIIDFDIRKVCGFCLGFKQFWKLIDDSEIILSMFFYTFTAACLVLKVSL